MKVAPLSINSSMDRSTRERLSAVTNTSHSHLNDAQADMTSEELCVIEDPPLPLAFKEEEEEDHKEKRRLGEIAQRNEENKCP
jgi:hypothetical protein